MVRLKKTEVKRRFKLVLQDIRNLLSHKIILNCIKPLPLFYEYKGDWIHCPMHHETNFYEGAFHFSEGHLFWPMKKTRYGFTEKVYRIDSLSLKQLRNLFQYRLLMLI